MKKKILLITLIMCILGGINLKTLNAQEKTVTIDGAVGGFAKYEYKNTDTPKLPIYNNEDYAITQIYYTADELHECSNGGTINSISFKLSENATQDSRKIDIYMKNSTSSVFATNVMIQLTSDDCVFSSGENEFEFKYNEANEGWIEIKLNKPFEYESGKNILICVNDKTGRYQSSSKGLLYFETFQTTDIRRSLSQYNRKNSFDPSSVINGSCNFLVPYIQFTFAAGSSSEPTPPTVDLTSPDNGATGIFNPSLSFTLGNAKQYQIQMAEGTGAFVIVQDWTDGNGNISYQTNLLKSNTAYVWKVVAKNDDGETTSDVYTFTTKEFAAPGELTNVSPENNAQNLINPELEWTFGENTEEQQLLIDGEVKVDWTDIGIKTSDSYQTSNLSTGSHTWQVNTRNGAGTTTGTEYSFTVASLPDNVTPISPANGATNVSSKTIKWQFADGTKEYRLLVHYGNDTWGWENGWEYQLGDNSTWIPTNGVKEMEIELPELSTGTTYYWAVDVQNSVGKRTVYQGGDPISTFSFTTASVLNTTYKSPENGATNIANAKLTWNYNGTPDYYQVLMGTAENELVAKTEWSAAEGTGGTYQTENLNNATQYYWQVNIKNGETVMEGEIWSFVTTLPAPTNVAANPAQIVPTLNMTYGSTTISWDDMGAAGYNVYLGATKLNAELITATSYEIADNTMKLSYNMNPGYDIYVQAIYAIGESNMSEAVNVKVTGSGYFKSIIENEYSHLAGATVTLTCTADEFGNEYDGNGRVYTFTTNSNGEVFETIVTNTSLRLYNGTYSVLVEKEYHNSFEGSVVISNNHTTEFNKTLTPDNTYVFTVTPFRETFESIDVYIGASVADVEHYYVYLKEGEEIRNLGLQGFTPDNNVAYFKYEGWAGLNNGDYQFGVAKTEDYINWSDIVTRDYNIFETDGNLSDVNNWREGLPGVDEDIYINANAVIEAGENLAYGDVTINGSLTINGKLTADMVNNAADDKLCINDGGQLIQNNEELKGMFVMDIVKPNNWGNNKDGWQFISSPIKGVSIESFIPNNGDYDLFKYDGDEDLEWRNRKANAASFGSTFEQGVGYLASYQSAVTATFTGTFNSATSHTWDSLTYNAEKPLANFHLLGNPFTFNMDMTAATFNNLVNGVAIVNNEGGYSYDVDTIPVGDGFFVQAIEPANATDFISLSYGVRAAKSEKSNSLNITATGNAGKDNVVINFAGKSEGFNKLQNFNDAIATVYVAEDGKNYGIYNCDADVQEVELNFNANKMGNYTISIEPNGEFETLTLVDRFTGVETNMLLEDYTFTAMSSDNHNRFIVRFVNGQQTTDNSHFVYQSGEELILNIQGDVQIVDVLGRVVYNGKAMNDINHINVSSFNSGAYMVRVMNGNDVKVEKVVIY